MTYVPAPAPDVPHKFQPGSGSEPGWCRCTRHEIDAIHRMPRWREVVVGALPSPEGENVLVSWGGAEVAIGRWLTAGPEGRGWYDKQDRMLLCPTHWHPMPAPPTKEPR